MIATPEESKNAGIADNGIVIIDDNKLQEKIQEYLSNNISQVTSYISNLVLRRAIKKLRSKHFDEAARMLLESFPIIGGTEREGEAKGETEDIQEQAMLPPPPKFPVDHNYLGKRGIPERTEEIADEFYEENFTPYSSTKPNKNGNGFSRPRAYATQKKLLTPSKQVEESTHVDANTAAYMNNPLGPLSGIFSLLPSMENERKKNTPIHPTLEELELPTTEKEMQKIFEEKDRLAPNYLKRKRSDISKKSIEKSLYDFKKALYNNSRLGEKRLFEVYVDECSIRSPNYVTQRRLSYVRRGRRDVKEGAEIVKVEEEPSILETTTGGGIPTPESEGILNVESEHENITSELLGEESTLTPAHKRVLRIKDCTESVCIIGAFSREGWVGITHADKEHLVNTLSNLPSPADPMYESTRYYSFGGSRIFRYQGPKAANVKQVISKTDFLNYFKDVLLPHLHNRPSLIMLDMASYHVNKPQYYWDLSKPKLFKFARTHNFGYDPSLTIDELLRHCRPIKPLDGLVSCEIKTLARQQGHQVLFFPRPRLEMGQIHVAFSKIKTEIRAPFQLEMYWRSIVPQRMMDIDDEEIERIYDVCALSQPLQVGMGGDHCSE